MATDEDGYRLLIVGRSGELLFGEVVADEVEALLDGGEGVAGAGVLFDDEPLASGIFGGADDGGKI